MIGALSLRRLEVLSRELGDDVRAGAYEFPRELRKVSELAVQFLVDVTRPSQLGINPFLRGFYFTGVRPVIKTDAVADERLAGPAPLAAGATAIFDARLLQPAPPPPPAHGRKVPEWVFLHRLFREVILVDDAAFKMTGGGTRVDLLRRGLLGAAAAACLLLSLGFTVSFANNRGLLKRAHRSLAAVGSVGGVPGTLGTNDLAELDELRAINAQLRHYERDGRPLHYQFGLYSGDTVHSSVRGVYFERFRLAMWNATRERLLGYLRTLPDRPNEDSDFGRAQDALAAHLLTTNEYRRSTADLLGPVLMSYWGGGAEQDSARAIAQRQFDFFATELPFGNPYNDVADEALVGHTQSFLRAFGREAYYRALVYSVSSKMGPVRFLGPANVVQNDQVVPGAFTKAGYANVLTNLDSVAVVFERYKWIYGNAPPPDKPTRSELLQTFEADYVSHWQQFLARGDAAAFTSVPDAVVKLTQLSQPTSPLLSMLETVAKETKMDSLSRITKAFQPVLVTTPPDQSSPAPEVVQYTQALGNLLGALTGLQAAGAAAPQAIGQASGAAAGVNNAVLSLAAKFNMASEARATAAQVQRLLRGPSDHAMALVQGIPAAELNGAARDFCRDAYAALSGKYPFNPGAQANADPVKVAEVFRKDEGSLWQFHQAKLQTYLTPQGNALPGQAVRNDFSSFMRRAYDFSSSMFREGPLSLYFNFQPQVPANAQVILQVGGDRKVFTQSLRGSQGLVWQADQNQEARLIVTFGNTPVQVAVGDGPWSLFRLFQNARWLPGSAYTVEWTIPGRNANLTADITFLNGVTDVLKAGHFQSLQQCPTAVIN
jgi:type VI secretion system protein ImpL